MPKKKAILKFNAYSIVKDAIETGLGFAMNQLEDVMGKPIPYEIREAAMPSMLNEVMCYLAEVIDWEKS